MIKAIFLDFYGTVVHEDGEVIKKISKEIYDTGTVSDIAEIGTYWWNEFQTSFLSAYGNNYMTQRELEYRSLANTIQHFRSTADAHKLSNMMFEHWTNPPIFEGSKQFFQTAPLPVYIVSNIDRDDIMKALSFHDLKPMGVFTSEDARSYKPRKELFEYALKNTGLIAKEVIHIGDSLSSDIKGAQAVGINPVWINRSGKKVPDGVISIEALWEVFDTDLF